MSALGSKTELSPLALHVPSTLKSRHRQAAQAYVRFVPKPEVEESCIIPCILLLTEDGDDGRTVDHDHVGNPCSSYPRISCGRVASAKKVSPINMESYNRWYDCSR